MPFHSAPGFPRFWQVGQFESNSKTGATTGAGVPVVARLLNQIVLGLVPKVPGAPPNMPTRRRVRADLRLCLVLLIPTVFSIVSCCQPKVKRQRALLSARRPRSGNYVKPLGDCCYLITWKPLSAPRSQELRLVTP